MRVQIRNEDDYWDAVSWVKTDASTFTENCILERDFVPTLENFIDRYPKYDNEELHHEIKKTIARVTELVQKELSNAT